MTARRLLFISGVLMLVVSALHTVGFLMPGTDPGDIAVEKLMRDFHYSFGPGMNPSKFDIYMGLVLMVTITLAGLGSLNLILASDAETSSPLLRRAIVANILWNTASIVLCGYYRVPPPLVFGLVIEIPLVAALIVKK